MTFKQKGVLNSLKNSSFIIFTNVALITGLLIGFGIRYLNPSPSILMVLDLPGSIFMHAMKILLIPYMCLNILIVVATLSRKVHFKLTVLTVLFALIANAVTTILGIAIAIGFKNKLPIGNKLTSYVSLPILYAELFGSIFPENVANIPHMWTSTEQKSNRTMDTSEVQNFCYLYSAKMICILFFTIIFGMGLRSIKTDGLRVIKLCNTINEAYIRILYIARLITPVVTIFIGIRCVASQENFNLITKNLYLVACAVISSVSIYVVVLISILACIIRRSPLNLLRYSSRAFSVAIATSSPVLAIPDMYKACDRYGIDTKISRYVIPMLTLIKSDGTAIYMGAISVFLVHYTGSEINTELGTKISFFIFVINLALPQIRNTAIITIYLMMEINEFDTHHIALLYAMDWFLDRIATWCTSFSTIIFTSFINLTCRKSLFKMRQDAQDECIIAIRDWYSGQDMSTSVAMCQ